MRAIWKGSVSFGLVSVPVRVYSATESHDLSLHQVHVEDGGRIRYQRRCEICDEVVDYDDITRAYDDGERTVVLTPDELAAVPAEQDREIEVLQFVPSDQIDPIRLDRAYYLAPEKSARKPYTLLRRTLEETDRSAVVRFAMRHKTHLAVLRVRDGVLLVQTMLWDDEIREPAFEVLEGTAPRISQKERDMAAKLVESLTEDFDPSAWTDEYQEQLRTLVEAKIEQGDAIDTDATFGRADAEEEAEVIDLMEALRRSVEQSRERRKKA